MGKRYNEDVDTFSFGAVLYEIAVRNLPYGDEIAEFKKQKRGGGAKKLMREVAHGERKPTLDGRVECRKYRVGGSFKKRALFTICGVALFCIQLIALPLLPAVLKHCVKFEPRQRPAMQDVVRRLENIIEAQAAKAAFWKAGPLVLADRPMAESSPWRTSSEVMKAMETFTSRIENVDLRTKLNELHKHVEADLGPQATDPHSGVYNPARLLRFLHLNDTNVADARTSIVLNSNARHEFKMDVKRALIVGEDLNFEGLPRSGELQKCQPNNPWIGRTKSGQVVSYINWGARCNYDALKETFSVVEYIDGRSYNQS